MAMIDRNFTFATNGTVTANDLHNLIDSATIYQDLITGQQPITSVGTNYELLIADGTNPNAAPNAVTVYDLFQDALTAGTYTNANISEALTYGTATGTRLVSTNATITTGTITTLNSTTGTITTLNSTTGTIATLNSTTGTIATLNSTTPTFLGAITASTNTINIGSGQIYKDASGNVGVGTASPGSPLVVSRNANDTLTRLILDNPNAGSSAQTILGLSNDGGTAAGLKLGSSTYSGTGGANVLDVFNNVSHTIFSIGGTERLRIDSSGNLLVGATSGAIHKIVKSSTSDFALQVSNTSSSTPYVQALTFASAAPNDETSMFLRCDDTGLTGRIQLRSNGGLANYSANNVNLSDERLKQDIQNSPSYLDKICSIPVVNFKYKDQTHSDYNLGVIAQRVEAVCPELVDVDGFGETPNDGIPLKSIYQTDLQYALMKCIQELKAENDSLKSRIEALEVK